jgi:DNA primase
MDNIQEVKNRIDIVELVRSYMKLEKSGVNFRGLCPFHNEKTPSFFISPARQIWHCFGCSRGGDVIKFVQDIEGMEFPDALRVLAERAGIVLRQEDPKIRSERQKAHDILEKATKYFEHHLKPGSAPYDYLLNRGLNEEIIKEFRIGFAPESWDGLLKAFQARGFKAAEVEKVGMVISAEDKEVAGAVRYYDRFRSRITFPIFDMAGRVIGFSGRIFSPGDKAQSEEIAKYVNTPNTLVYDKSRVLYGLDRARQEIRVRNTAILVEGQMDLIMSHKAGIKNAIATSGTALTPLHLQMIKRYTNRLLVAFDVDEAGRQATKRSIDLALKAGFDVGVIVVPSGQDPADLVKENPNVWRETVDKARPVMEYYFETILADYDLIALDDKKEATQIFLPEIKKLTNAVERAHWLSKFASALKVKEDVLDEELKKIKFSSENTASDEEKSSELKKETKSRAELIGERLLSLILSYPKYKIAIAKSPNFFENHSDELAAIFESLKSGQKIKDSKLADFVNFLNFQAEIYPVTEEEAEKEINTCLRELQVNLLKKELSRLSGEIKEAEEKSDRDRLNLLSENFRTKTQELNDFIKPN